MNLIDRVDFLSAVGKAINTDLINERLETLFIKAENENPWFTTKFSDEALRNVVANYLDKEELLKWVQGYSFNKPAKSIGVVAAGNIPFVGIHDLLSVFISGNEAQLKLSAKDSALMKYVLGIFKEIDASAAERIQLTDRLKGFDAVIATGSDNTNRYFEQYFGKYPNLLRKNRTSVAVINGSESDEQLKQLVYDLYSYFGLGCRSVSKVFIPTDFKLEKLLDACSSFDWLQNHYKHHNNYTYQKSIYLVNKVSHFDTGFSIFREEPTLHSPISVTFYQRYNSEKTLIEELNAIQDRIQIVLGKGLNGVDRPVIPFGNSQKTTLQDYADSKNTLDFLAGLK